MFSNIWKKRQQQVLEERFHVSCLTHLLSGIEEGSEQEVSRVVAEVLSQLKGYLYEKNLEFTRDMTTLSHKFHAVVEAEIGRISGRE